MNTNINAQLGAATSGEHCLRFAGLFSAGRGFVFPCRPDGSVEIDALSDRVRNNYLFARAMVGRELAYPVVEPTRGAVAA